MQYRQREREREREAQRAVLPLASWNVSNVTNMDYMFREAELFNQSLDSWNVSKVTNMKGLELCTFVFSH